jgi:competence protein ComFC
MIILDMGFLDLLFPKQCFGCKKYGAYLCERCVPDHIVNKNSQHATHIVKQKCIVCEKWAIDGFTHPRCEGKYNVDRIVSLWDYNGAIRRAIISLKYKFASEIAKELAEHSVGALRRQNLFRHPEFISGSASVPVLIPIPMHWKRKNWRGFNQVEEIGKRLSQSLNLQWEPNLLVRTKQTRVQAGLKAEARSKNVQGVFSINSNYEQRTTNNKLFILFDDVYTTGATLKEAGRVLKKAGTKKVWALTIAR